jgi:peptidoglycan-associated lipoprotein
MRAIWLAIIGAGLAGCATGPGEEQKPAGVEERRAAGVQPAGPAAKPQPMKPGGVARVDLTAKPKAPPMSPLKDPNNILSKRSIFYDYDKFDVKDEFRALVEAHAKYLRANPAAKMLIQGNTDERGSREYNLGLGQRRSDGVKKMMVLLGAKEEQIETVSLGEEKPRAEGHDEGAWAQNRRSDILYQGEY